ncbi:hypothetical protein DC31_09745 [Microbacterium sp. CH12i]|uniref:DUF4350 domain-containing protein n=1 Tax=Microbacterium sp. CH12i TaxID=1479651 RepID=UPI000461F5A2|nr:DUF4350 domain-containing protein [Microbacterium sp. CH12i]KDA06635.1 hypothetical protein DC31_09745 [Microbacterium sp. CH12i]
MSTAQTDAAASIDAPSTAYRQPGRLRSMLGWLSIAVLVIVFALFVGSIGTSAPGSRGSLDPESAKDSGSLALAELLRDQGVDVTVVRTRAAAVSAISADTTLVMADPFTLSDEAVEQLIKPASHTVFVSSASRLLRVLDLGENAPAAADEALTARCNLPELANVGTVRPDRFFTPADGVTGCYPDDAGSGAGVLIDDRGDNRTVLVDGDTLFSNEHLAENGNAALGLALLGQSDHVVWYVPSFEDSDLEAQSPDTLATLTPPWVTPAILLLLLAGIVAGIARGQRFGPLVSETLPVTVRASETMHGRARLTAKAADAAHAAEALRDGTLRRLAKRLGLAARSTPADIADAAADRLRIQRGSLHELLAGALPATDSDLIDTARRLAELEAAVETAVHVERKNP